MPRGHKVRVIPLFIVSALVLILSACGGAVPKKTSPVKKAPGDNSVVSLQPSEKAQQGLPTWTRTYGGSKNDQAAHAISVRGGGYLMVGRTFSKGAGSSDGWAVRLDEEGKVLWERTYGGTGLDALTTVIEASRKGYYVAGVTNSKGQGGVDGWVLRLDEKGEILWEQTLGGKLNDAIAASALMADGSVLLAGYTRSQGAGKRDAWFVKVGEDGKVVWNRAVGGKDRDEMAYITPIPGGGFAAAGITKSFGAGNADAWVILLDAQGQHVWDRKIGDAAWNAAQFISPMPGGGFIAAGNTRSKTSGKSDVWVFRLDPQGKLLWEKSRGGADIDYATSVHALRKGGVLVGGVTRSKGEGGYDAWLIALDDGGNPKWDTTMGSSGNNGISRIMRAANGGFIVAGFTSEGTGGEDFNAWVILLNEEGQMQ